MPSPALPWGRRIRNDGLGHRVQPLRVEWTTREPSRPSSWGADVVHDGCGSWNRLSVELHGGFVAAREARSATSSARDLWTRSLKRAHSDVLHRPINPAVRGIEDDWNGPTLRGPCRELGRPEHGHHFTYVRHMVGSSHAGIQLAEVSRLRSFDGDDDALLTFGCYQMLGGRQLDLRRSSVDG